MTFSDFECRVLEQCELDARLPSQRVARSLRVRTERVARARHAMLESGRIAMRAFLNPMALGYFDIKVFFSITACSARQRKSLFDLLKVQPGVGWLGSYAGDYRYGVAFYCRQPQEIAHLFDRIGEKYEDVFSAKTVLLRLRFLQLARSWTDRVPKPRAELSIASALPLAELRLDALDQAILWHLGSGALESLRELARSLGEVSSTIVRRVQRLEQLGIIRGYYYAVDARALCVETYRLLLSFSALTKARREQIYRFARTHVSTAFLIESIGAWDFELGVETKRAREINEIIAELHTVAGDSLRDLRVLTELEELHSSFYPFPGPHAA